jgi:hypothetical protein
MAHRPELRFVATLGKEIMNKDYRYGVVTRFPG